MKERANVDWSSIRWMNYSGSPALFVPESLLRRWHGFFLPAGDSREDLPDLELPSGHRYNICDDFDFAHPRTDYDHLCARLEGKVCVTFPVPGGELLSVSDGNDLVGWWSEACTLVTGGQRLPGCGHWDELHWEPEVEWYLPDSTVFLMNACLHGAEPELGQAQGQFARIFLDVGRYSVCRAHFEGLNLYRFRVIEL